MISMSFETASQFIVFEGAWSPRIPRRSCLPLSWSVASIVESIGERLSASLIQRFIAFRLFECLINRFGTIKSKCIPASCGLSDISLITYTAESTEVCRPARARFCRWANSRSISRRRQIVLNIVKKRKASQPLSRPDASNENYLRLCSYFSELTVRRLRPLARRALSTRRPFFVAIRARKPCLLARLRRWGWYVRFILVVFLYKISGR